MRDANVTGSSPDQYSNFTLNTGWTGIQSFDNLTAGGEVEPPDQGLATDGNYVVEIVNDVIRISNINGTSTSLNKSIATFFNDPQYSCGDVQTFYDNVKSRWIITQMRSSTCYSAYNYSTEGIDVAVSVTSNPLGSYRLYRFRANSNDIYGCGRYDCFPDYPKAGFNQDGLFVSVDLFNAAPGGNFVRAATYAFPKSLMYSGATISTYGRIVYPADDFVVQPSVSAPGQAPVTTASGVEYLLDALGGGSGTDPLSNTGQVRVWAISQTSKLASNPRALTANSVNISTQPFYSTVASSEPSDSVLVCASNSLPAPLIDGGYTSFQSTIQFAGNKLYGALPAGNSDSSANQISWFILQPSVNLYGRPSAQIVAQGALTASAGYSLSYPALAMNNTGKGVMGISIMNPNKALPGGYPSTAVVPFDNSGPGSTIYVTGQGVTSDGGFSGCTPNQGNVGRWGDYGAAVINPKSTDNFFTANENISVPTNSHTGSYTNWGTYITSAHY